MVIVQRKIKDLKRAEYNPRFLNPQSREDIRKSLTIFGFVDPVIVNKNPDRLDIIIGGHQRTDVWEEMGHDEVPTVEVNLSLERERELNIRLNKNTGDWDWEMLQKEFDKADLLDWGFNLNELPKPEDVEASIKSRAGFDAEKSQNEENYNITYQIVFQNEDEQARWFQFITRLKKQYPNAATISERLIQFVETHLPANEQQQA